MAYSYDRRTASAGRTVSAGESFDQWYENISFKASQKLRDLDETFVGTPDYMGIAYFWSSEYKFSLRDASPDKRRAVHAAFLKAGLPVDGESPQHEAIVEKIVGL